MMSSRLQQLASHWQLLAAIAALAMLAVAHAFEAAGFLPCELCLRQREVYWAAAAVGLAGFAARRMWRRPMLRRAFSVVLGVVFLVGAGIAAYHTGVEWKFWPGPTTCGGGAGGNGFNPSDLDKPVIIVPCDEAAWRDPVLHLSMAGWNTLVSLALGGLSSWAARKDPVDD
jgi:disulfide bond formation protein DsbB